MKIEKKIPIIPGTTPWMQADFYLNPNKSSIIDLFSREGIKPSDCAMPEQVHGNKVLFIHSPGEYAGMDGLLTNTPGITLLLKVADCVPVFLSDSKMKVVGLVHSGWRGTVKGIVPNAIRTFIEKGSQVEDIQLFLGPAICESCFEVGEKVAEQFDDSAIITQPKGKYFAHLHQQIISQCLGAGIVEENIITSSICTFEDSSCHSYRRDGDDAGRMVAAMRILP